jgi:MFS family permease
MRDLHLNNAQIGMLGFIMMIGWGVSSLVLSALSDRLGRRKPILVGVYLAFAAFSALGALAGSFATLLVSRLLMGLAEGPAVPVQQAVMAAESSPHRRAFNMGITQNFGSQLCGALLGPLLMVQLALAIGWRGAFLVSGVPALIMAFVIARFVREPAKGNEVDLAQADDSLRFRDLISHRNVWLAGVVGAATAAWFYLLVTFLPVWSVRELHFSPQVMSVVMSAMGVGGVASAVMMPWLAERLGRRPVMVLTAGLGAVAPLAALTVGAPTALVVLAVAVGSFANAMFPLCCTVAVEASPPRSAAMAAAVVYSVSTLVGGVIGPLSAGFMADRFGLATTLWLAAGMAVAAAAVSGTISEHMPTTWWKVKTPEKVFTST